MKKTAYNISTLSILFSIGIAWFLFIQWKTISKEQLSFEEEKHKGAHIFGELDSTNLQPFLQCNYNWLSLVPWGDQKDFDSPTMTYFKGDSLDKIRRDSMWKSQIDIAHKAGLRVMLKPHIWLYRPSDGKWRSDIFPSNRSNWDMWQKNYRAFILLYAQIAEANDVEVFCIGTELTRLSLEKADFWKKLIHEVRQVYCGKLTYAANWYQEYEQITFWKDLDFIGIQAYFPLAKHKNPSVEALSIGWNQYLPNMESVSKKFNRKVLFTEMGYKSTADSAIEPWTWIDYTSDKNQVLSNETQANCYSAFFNTIWEKEWFVGVHIWQMRSDFEKGRGKSHLDFTPQGKPAEKIISSGFE